MDTYRVMVVYLQNSPEVARDQAENEARQRWHDGQVEWGIQQGYLNPDGSPKETN
ncbi:hypothetical protein [Streptococcus thermophilus]|uniref:hypothetical protein n=1 Tax=Streptococcus thermophilus TaxID=1308 RepID=UPI0022EAD4C4|nr:hypothetical protein [Streptococcus thermophilus]MDA3766658.1 hypothetical protein [Streptococcus thermophilus]MDA3774603.1 hypothetical protein [Streptococcus thermophilus]